MTPPPFGPRSLAGLAKWLRVAAENNKPITIAPATARILADAVDAKVREPMEGRAA